MIEDLESVDWVSHIEPPRTEESRPEHVVRYLTRYFGGWSNTRKDDYLERCETALEDAGLGIEAEIDFDVKSIEASEPKYLGDAPDCDSGLVCEHCGSESLTLIDEIDKSSWTDLFRSGNEACPDWYRESLDLDDRRFWDAAMGEGFSHLVRLVVRKVNKKVQRSRSPSQTVLPPPSSSSPGTEKLAPSGRIRSNSVLSPTHLRSDKVQRPIYPRSS
ncbi:hypothetical protein NZK35_26905 [Stieleria sp. ICT_E10.1]|uniref:hypothetical protein n=1 Tax=Stieleria sedimenti TaxID=2976331 RepID=UPI0021808D4D|nr:hypothetical protein [Stieleria sedimenti]MCS7470294.1 hypothetical protein [Stieleria sedimenti]